MNGIESGYLNTMPCDALTLAITMHTNLKMARNINIGMPIKMKHKGIVNIMYRSIESWKFIEDLPLRLTHSESSFLDIQQISGPIIPPNGKKYPMNAERWQNIAQSRSDCVYVLFSSMVFCFKDDNSFKMLHFLTAYSSKIGN
jgi:hypothetical protein